MGPLARCCTRHFLGITSINQLTSSFYYMEGWRRVGRGNRDRSAYNHWISPWRLDKESPFQKRTQHFLSWAKTLRIFEEAEKGIDPGLLGDLCPGVGAACLSCHQVGHPSIGTQVPAWPHDIRKRDRVNDLLVMSLFSCFFQIFPLRMFMTVPKQVLKSE